MSAEHNYKESKRWLETAQDDLQTAQVLLENKRFSHACFHAQQAAEKALKSVWYHADDDPWGHSILKLITDLVHVDASIFGLFKDKKEIAAYLDRFYIPTRYPNGLPELTPQAAFFEADARKAISLAQQLLDLTESIVL